MPARQRKGTEMKAKFVPTKTMIRAAEMVFATMAIVGTIRPVVEKYQAEILARGQWRVSEKFDGTRMGDDEVIVDPNLSYLMAEEDFALYHAQCKEARALANLKVEQEDQCPLLVAEDMQRKAEHALIEAMEPVTGLTVHKLLCAGMAKYKEYVELNLRLMAPFVEDGKQIAEQLAAG